MRLTTKALRLLRHVMSPLASKANTQSDIEANLLGKVATAKAIMLHMNDKPCGFAVYYDTISTTTGKRGLHLDDLYVEPAYQGKGLGRKALVYLAKVAKEKKCARLSGEHSKQMSQSQNVPVCPISASGSN